MRVCYFGTFEAGYERNRIMQRALATAGVEVITCHEPLLDGTRHKTGFVRSPTALVRLGGRASLAYARLASRYLRLPDHDAVVVGCLGHADVFLARLLATLRGKPVIFDAFISLWDTLAGDRALFARRSLPARALRLLDRMSCRAADAVLLDTDAHIAFFADELGVDARRMHRVAVGAEQACFFAETAERQASAEQGDAPNPFVVLFYGKLAPLHGLEHILEAAKLLEHDPSIHFVLVGSGQLEEQVQQRMAQLHLRNVERHTWWSCDQLRARIGTAGACLGIFGTTGKASRVIPNKVYQGLAAGGAVITGDTPAARELLQHEHDALLCPVGDGPALAACIERLHREPDLRARLRRNALRTFAAHGSEQSIGVAFRRVLEDAVQRRGDVARAQ